MIKIAYEIIDWIFNDDEKTDADYRGIMKEPYTKAEDVSEQLQALRQKGLSKGDKRIDSFLSKTDPFEMTDPYDIRGEINTNNDRWRDDLIADITKAENMDDLDTARTGKFEPQMNNYEDDWVREVETMLATMGNTLRTKETRIREEERIAREEEERKRTEMESIGGEFTAAIEDAISAAERAPTKEEVDIWLTKPYSIGELRRMYGNEYASKISSQVAEATERLFTIREEKPEEEAT